MRAKAREYKEEAEYDPTWANFNVHLNRQGAYYLWPFVCNMLKGLGI